VLKTRPHRKDQIPHLRAVREAQGLGLREAARRSGIDPGHLSKVERGQAKLSVEALARLAGVLELRTLADLLGQYVGGES
jgi:transcriptional regulator with XRE-family HTH domain